MENTTKMAQRPPISQSMSQAGKPCTVMSYSVISRVERHSLLSVLVSIFHHIFTLSPPTAIVSSVSSRSYTCESDLLAALGGTMLHPTLIHPPPSISIEFHGLVQTTNSKQILQTGVPLLHPISNETLVFQPLKGPFDAFVNLIQR